MMFRLLLLMCCVAQLPAVTRADRQSAAVRVASGDSDQTFEWAVDVAERPWEFVVIHHSATSAGSVESIHREHRSRRDRNGQPWLGIGYHFVIGNGQGMADGEISASFRWREQLHGAHCGSLRHNGRGIGICLIGNFEEYEPTAAQRESVMKLLRALTDRYDIPKARVLGHDQVRATACPGRWFPLREVVEDSVSDRPTKAAVRSNPVYQVRAH